jgi:hypothetical protein
MPFCTERQNVILSGPRPVAHPQSLCEHAFLLSSRGAAGDEESCSAKKLPSARFLAEFTLSTQSEILRCAQDDSEGLGMTVKRRLSHRLHGRAFDNPDS